VAELLARGRALDTSRPLVMGILNRTTDSFFDHGTYYAFDQFLAKAEELVIAGAERNIGEKKAKRKIVKKEKWIKVKKI
jgi:dihydropteroate synthase